MNSGDYRYFARLNFEVPLFSSTSSHRKPKIGQRLGYDVQLDRCMWHKDRNSESQEPA
jgi:hypothetical protein